MQANAKQLETAARHAKDRQIIAKASGDDVLRRLEQERINAITHKYKQLSNASGLPTKMERMSVSKYHRVKTNVEKYTSKLKNTTTSNGIKITEVSKHLPQRAYERKADMNKMYDALTNPLDVGKIKTDKYGKRSQQFIGEHVTVAVNPDTGVVCTIWKTSSKLASKLKKVKGK